MRIIDLAGWRVYDCGVGLIYRRRKRIGRRSYANVSRSGVSVSQREGRLTVSSRGRGSVRLLPGLSYRFRWHR